MADSFTAKYGYVLPEVGASADVWGGKLNQDFSEIDATDGPIVTGGAPNVYTLTTGLSLAAHVTGQAFDVRWNVANTGATTLNIDGLGIRPVTKNGTAALVNGDILTGQVDTVANDGTNWVIQGERAKTISQPVDGTLSALAALITAANQYIRATGVDTFTMDTANQVATLINALKTTGGTMTGQFRIQRAGPQILFVQTGATAQEGKWDLICFSDQMFIRTINDAEDTAALIAAVARTGTTPDRLTVFPQLAGTAGSAALPAYAPNASDPDTGLYSVGLDILGVSVGGVKKLDIDPNRLLSIIDIVLPAVAPTNDLSAGYRRFAPASVTTGAPASSDSGKTIYATGDVVAPASTFAQGDAFGVYAGAANRSITPGVGVTMRLHGTATTGARTVLANGFATVLYISPSECTVFGDVT